MFRFLLEAPEGVCGGISHSLLRFWGVRALPGLFLTPSWYLLGLPLISWEPFGPPGGVSRASLGSLLESLAPPWP